MKSFLCVLRNFASHDCLFSQKCPHTRFKRRFLVYFYHFWPFFSGFFLGKSKTLSRFMFPILFYKPSYTFIILEADQAKSKKHNTFVFLIWPHVAVCKSTPEILHEELAAHKSCYDRHILRHPYHEWCFNTSFFATNSMMFEWFSSSIILLPERLSSFSFVSKMGTHTSLKINVLK